jgi:hypothetical protein
MAKSKAKAGRPKADNPKSILISFRVDAATVAAIEKQRDKMGVMSFSLSDTVRETLLRALKREGLL